MLLFLKSTSRTVHHYHEEEQDSKNSYNTQESSMLSLTVWRKSLLFNCNGFTVIASDGSLIYRVDNYTGHPDRIILMDASGYPIYTICPPKKLRFANNHWLVYEGEVGNDDINPSKKPIFRARKNISIMKTKPSILAYIYGGIYCKGFTYTVEGSYVHRSCKILDDSRRVVAEIKKKEALTRSGVSFGLEVFDLIVKPGIESRVAMAIVLLLDQMFS